MRDDGVRGPRSTQQIKLTPKDMIENRVVLVTGASGFTGKYLCSALRDLGARVIELSELPSAAPDKFQCDLIDKSQVGEVIAEIRPDFVIHLAAISFVATENPEAFYAVNVIGTCNLLHALTNCTPEKIIIASSANIYGQVQGGQPISEDQVPAPINHYASSKLAMEHMAKTWFEELPIIVTRPFNYTGPGQDERFLIPKIVAHFAERKEQIELGNLRVSRDFTYVGDVVEAYLLLLQSKSKSTVINICSGETCSLRQILNRLELLSGHELKVRVNPELVRKNEIEVLRGDNSLLKELTGWAPNYQLDEVLEMMLNSRID